MNPLHYRRDIDGLRAIAVLTVVLFHAGFAIFSGGFVGVDVFFVISGFLITGIIKADIDKGRFSFARFYTRRVRRLFPALFMTVVVSFIAAFLLFSAEHLARFSGALIYALTSLSNFYFWAESGYFDTSAEFKPLLHTWSLSVEEQFYMIWPATLVLLLGFLHRGVVIGIIVVMGIASLVAAELFLDSDAAAAFFLTPFRIAEFAVGALLVWLMPLQPRNPRVLDAILALGLALILVPVFTYTKETPFPGLTAMLPCIGTGMAIYAGRAPLVGRVLSWRPMVAVGLVSYSCYLIHWPLIVFYQYWTFDPLSLWEKCGLVIASLALAGLSYRFVEQPFRVPHPDRPRWAPASLGLAASLLVLVMLAPAASGWATGGWAWRITERAPPAELVHTVNARKGARYRQLEQLVPEARASGLGLARRDAAKALVIGDSHAGQFTALYDSLGKAHNINVTLFTLPGCPPIFGTFKVYGERGIERPIPRQTACRDLIVEWERIVRSGGFDYVVLASRWAWLFEPTEYGPYTIRRDFLVDAANPVYTTEAARQVFADGLARTIDVIRDSGAEAIVISQVPNQGKRLDGCDAIPTWIVSEAALVRRCTGIDGETARARLAFTNRTISALAGREGVHVLIPSDIFCADDRLGCRAYADGVSLYRDSNHVNRFGAMYLARTWEQMPDFPFRQASP